MSPRPGTRVPSVVQRTMELKASPSRREWRGRALSERRRRTGAAALPAEALPTVVLPTVGPASEASGADAPWPVVRSAAALCVGWSCADG
ncbi:hypothetical protein GCM10009823_15520 [Brevibacterium salitolerans]|uniref:Uncharacterized protein n=1 Tax=Brevibacterium salitolerans TaxID=1403566 RepID=A0ABN2WMZ7_9MICO